MNEIDKRNGIDKELFSYKILKDKKRIVGEKATEYIKDGMILGLGTGSTAYYMIKRVGDLVQDGMKLKAVATSKFTEDLANELKIPLISIDKVDTIDLCID